MNEKSWEIYSKIVASEGISLQYEHCPTAYFDMKTRTVHIPDFNFLNDEITMLLVSHEVAHAKYTKYDINSFLNYTKRYKSLFNVVEDAFIEREIKQEFKGLSNIFYEGYKGLYKNNFFDIDLNELPDYSLTSRLNLYAKIGHIINIPFFNAEENQFALEIKNLKSSEDVIALCEKIYNYIKEKKEQEKKEKGVLSDCKYSKDGKSKEEKEKNISSDDNGNYSVPNAGDLEDDDNDSENSSNDEKEENEGSSSSNGKSIDDELTDNITEKFNNNLSSYGNSKINEEKIYGYEKIIELNTKYYNNIYIPRYMDYYDLLNRNGFYKKKPYKAIINGVKNLAKTADMVFKQKKSADELKKTRNFRTGNVDIKKLAKYKISENLFVNKKIIPEGKNHGLVILIDYSGSMQCSNAIKNTLIQACVLGEFCRMNDIPFEIVAFGVSFYGASIREASSRCVYVPEIMILGNSASFDIGCIIYLINHKHIDFSSFDSSIHDRFTTGDTPTIEGLMYISNRIEAFYKTGIEKISLYIISDGMHNDTIVSNNKCYNLKISKKIVINNVLYNINDYIDKNKNHYSDWIVELICARLKKLYNVYISFNYITHYNNFVGNLSKNIYDKYNKPENWKINHPEGSYSIDEIAYLYKHGLFFDNKEKIPTKLTNKMISYNFNKNPFFDQVQILDISTYYENFANNIIIDSTSNEEELDEKMKELEEKNEKEALEMLTKDLLNNKILKLFVTRYIEEIA